MTDIRLSREQLLEAANASPSAVGRHDREAWIDLFSADYCVEDPIGAKPHQPNGRKRKPLENFYDTFIAPNNIKFHVENDIVAENKVIRDVTIELSMGKGVKAFVPMYLVYKMVEENALLKISSLQACWELWPMIKQVLGRGFGGFVVFSLLGFRMVRIQGISGALGFSKGFSGIGQQGKKTVYQFLTAFNNGETDNLNKLFDRENEGIYVSSISQSLSPESFITEYRGSMSSSKTISAGHFVSCTLKSDESNGIGLFSFNHKTKRIRKGELYFDGAMV